MPGLATGFMQGFGLVNDIGNQRRQQAMQQHELQDNEQFRQQQFDAQQQYRDQRLAQAADAAKYQHQRDAIGDQHWNQEYAAQQHERGLKDQLLATQNQSAELKMAAERRAQTQAENERNINAALAAMKDNGGRINQEARHYLKQGGVPIDKMVDPKFQQALKVVNAGVQGAPVDKHLMVHAAGRVFQNKIDNVIGTKAANGQTIVRAKLNQYLPGRDPNILHFGLKLWTKDKKGNIHTYKAPVTPNRSSQDKTVLDIPMDQAIAYLHGLNYLDLNIPKQHLMSLIHEHQVLNQSIISGKTGDWKLAHGNTLFNSKTGQTQQLPTIKDPAKRAAKALDLAQKDLASKVSALKEIDQEMSDADAQKFLTERQQFYIDHQKPKQQIKDPDPSVIEKLKANGGAMIPKRGKYAGNTIKLQADGSVVVIQ